MNMLEDYLQLDSFHTARAVSLYANMLKVFQLISQFSLDINNYVFNYLQMLKLVWNEEKNSHGQSQLKFFRQSKQGNRNILKILLNNK